MVNIIATITEPLTGETKQIMLSDIQRGYDYTADVKRAIEIVRREYADPVYNLRITL